MNINWSIAPDWAIGHALYAFGGEICEVWVGEDKYQLLDQSKSFPYGGGVGETRHNPCRYQFRYETLRPAPWTGEGLPPVGVLIEMKHKRATDELARSDFYRAFLEWVGAEHFVTSQELFGSLDDYIFRPLRTPEQIAEEEREKDIIAALEVMKIAHWRLNNTEISPLEKCRIYAEAMVTAGYRKQVAE